MKHIRPRQAHAVVVCAFAVLAAGPLLRASRAIAAEPDTPTLDIAAPKDVTNRLPVDWRQGVRLQFDTGYAPEADIGGASVSLVRPLARLRLRGAINHRLFLQLSTTFAANHYDIDDNADLLEDCPQCPEPEDFQEVSMALISGYLLNPNRHLFRTGERWGVLGGVFGRARWEEGAFEDSATGGGSLGVGYEIPERLRLGIGARVETKIEGGVSVSPEGHFRWDITDRWRLHDRALGLSLHYRPGSRFEYSVSGYRTSDTFLLDSRATTPSDLTFEDRRLVVALGLEWRAFRHLRIRGEAGAIVDRRLAYEADGDRLETISGDPSAYLGLRFELRP